MKASYSAFAFSVLAPLATTSASVDVDRVEIYGPAGTPNTLNEYFNFDAYDTVLQVADVESEYDTNQNQPGRTPRTIDSVSHGSISADGNSWSAYLLPEAVEITKDSVLKFSFALEADTVDGFQAVCLDADDQDTDSSNGQCFVLHSSQGWVSGMVNVQNQTAVGETSHHSIPIGDFFTGPVNYVAFIQDSDGGDRPGNSSVSDLQLLHVSDDALAIEIGGQMAYLNNDQLSYTNNGADNEDEKDYWMTLSEDKVSITVAGNQWKALPLPQGGYSVTKNTVLEFDIIIDESVDKHAICLDVDVDYTTAANECVVLQNSESATQFHHLATKLQTNVQTKLVIPFGSYMNLGPNDSTTVNYLGFIQDNDQTAKNNGRSTWSNFRLYEENRMDAVVTVFGANVTLPNVQYALANLHAGDTQDSRDHLMSISADGNEITASGNSWKYLTFPAPFEVAKTTVLKFDFTLEEESEIHYICLLNQVYLHDGRTDCFSTAGTSTHSTSAGKKLEYTAQGQTKSYEIMLGHYFTGEVQHLGLVIENNVGSNDFERIQGQSTWTNIEIYTLPFLNVGLDADVIAVDNHQISYKSASDDSTPIKDHMATISEDGSSINMVGNMWRALELPTRMSPYSLGDFVVSFDFALGEAGEVHGICFEENLKFGNQDNPADSEPKRCLSTAFFQDKGGVNNVLDVILAKHQTRVGETHRYVLNLKKLFDRLDYSNGATTYPPTPSPTPSTIQLEDFGTTPPASSRPLQQCQGDCDNDNDCDGALKCLQRDGFEAIPGCVGSGVSGYDYCFARQSDLHLWKVGDNGIPASGFPLQECEGDCDDDSDCAGNLTCEQRGGFTPVTGCIGKGISHNDYCVDKYKKQPDIKYIAFMNDNDADRSVGNSTISNIGITTSLSSCLDSGDFGFTLNDCTADNFLTKVKELMNANAACVSKDPLLELFAIFGATQETDVYDKIEKICTEAYKLSEYDFADNTLGKDGETERQIVKEFIDGGTVFNYEDDETSTTNIAKLDDKYSTSRLLSYPKHHALDNCDVGAAMCCFVASRTTPEPVDSKNSDVCYVDMQASRRTAHVADGYSIYGGSTDNVYCEGFAWGNDGGSMASALKGNALFKVGFMENMVSNGSVEQVPGAPLCGCIDRMPVVTEAACTDVTDPTSEVVVSFDSTASVFEASFTVGEITYGNCGDKNLVDYYDSLVSDGKASSADADYLKKRIVGDGGCGGAINEFLSEKGLAMA